MANTTRKETKERKRKQAEERNAAFQALPVEEKRKRNPKKHYEG